MSNPANLVDFVSDPAFALDGNLHVVAWNKGAQSLMGYSSSEVINRTCYEVLQAILPGGEPLCTPGCKRVECFRQGQLFGVPSCKVRCKDGQFIAVSLSSMIVPPEIRSNSKDGAIAIVFLHQHQMQPACSILQSLQVFSFGHFGLVAEGRGLNVDEWKRKQALTLLKYLITCRGHAVPRERLMECLWPEGDEHHGRDRLKVTLYYLRNQLREAGIADEVVETVGHAYLLRGDKIWLDADVFELSIFEGTSLMEQGNWDEAMHCFEDAHRLYRGDYLEDEPYEDWCAEERERLRELYLNMLAKLAQCYVEGGGFFKAVQVCRSALTCEPCREYFHRMLMVYLTQSGQRDQAITHYKDCQRILKQELGVEPMTETQKIYQQILEHEITADTGHTATLQWNTK